MKEFHGTIENDDLVLPIEQLNMRKQYLKSNNGKRVVEILKLERKPKSTKQLGNHFGNAIATLVRTFEDRGWDSSYLLRLPIPTGVPCNAALFQQFFYASYPTTNEVGKIITMSDFTTKDESVFFEAIRNHASSQWSIYIPDPDPNWKSHEVR